MFDIIEFADQLNELISENYHLREENKYLKQQLKKSDNFIDQQYKETQKQLGEIFTTLLNRSE
jgi:regulator of replication initiation timing